MLACLVSRAISAIFSASMGYCDAGNGGSCLSGKRTLLSTTPNNAESIPFLRILSKRGSYTGTERNSCGTEFCMSFKYLEYQDRRCELPHYLLATHLTVLCIRLWCTLSEDLHNCVRSGISSLFYECKEYRSCSIVRACGLAIIVSCVRWEKGLSMKCIWGNIFT